MYLKLIRHKRPFGQLQRGTLYRVHFQPNVKGRYDAILNPICDVYEVSLNACPPALIYPVGVVRIDGRYRLTFGIDSRCSMLHLIDRNVRDAFITEVRYALFLHEEVRLEVAEEK